MMAKPMFSDELVRYLDGLVPPREAELTLMEQRGIESGFPIIGPACGHLGYLIARLIGARQVFEMGSGYGYSTAWFARAVVENGGGKVVHTVWDEQLSQDARRHLSALGFGEVVEYRVGESVDELRRTPGPFDLVFLDIDKEGYPGALDVIEEKIRPGGVLLADNLLLHGSILDAHDRSARAEAVRILTHRTVQGNRWIGSIVPLRDGLLVAFRR
jgi:predicted O-methyltransferase YrrM